MNDREHNSPNRAVRLHGALFLLGLGVGFGLLCLAGWRASRTDYHPGFVRLLPAISPETSYYPTLNELSAIVRSHCRQDQTLVVIGGNSILQGVWQPTSEIWTAHLQQLLGAHYSVVNLAMRGALPSDGGAVVAEALRHEFPHQIYVADESPFANVSPIGHEPYRYLFWQAYFRGDLIRTPARQAAIDELMTDPQQRDSIVEQALQTYADQLLHFEDFWNWVAYTRFNTVPSYLGEYFPRLLTPRHAYPDTEPDATDPAYAATRYPSAGLETEMHILRNTTGLFYLRTPSGEWKMPRYQRRDVAENYAVSFPDELKARTLMLVGRGSAYYRQQLSPEEQVREDLAFRDAVLAWRAAGYASLEFGRDYTEDDYGDRSHLSKTGGRKLAESVAPAIVDLATKLGYPR